MTAEAEGRSSSGLVPPYLLAPVDFDTTRRTLRLHHAANLVILPAYFTAVFLVLRGLTELVTLYSPELGALLAVVCGIAAAAPVLLDLLAPDHWRALNRPRVISVLVSVALVLVWQGIGDRFDAAVYTVYLTAFAVAIILLVRSLIKMKWVNSRWAAWLLNVACLMVAGFVLMVAAGLVSLATLTEWLNPALLVAVVLLAALAVYLTAFAVVFILLVRSLIKMKWVNSRWAAWLLNVACLMVAAGGVSLATLTEWLSPALLVAVVLLAALAVYLPMMLLLASRLSRNIRLRKRRHTISRFIMNPQELIVATLLFVIVIVSFFRLTIDQPEGSARDLLLGLISLLIVLFSAFPRLFLSEQIASLRHLLRHQRHERLLSRMSPFVQPRSLLAQARSIWIPKLLSPENRTLAALACLAVGGIGVPLLLHVLVNRNPIDDPSTFGLPGQPIVEVVGSNPLWFLTPTQLLLIGLVTTGVLLLVYSLWYAAIRRDRYVITDFGIQTAQAEDKPYMDKVASASRRMLIDELQTTGALLKQRQIENVNFVREDANALFVTSGLEGEFFEQIQEIVTVEVGSSGRAIDLGRLSQFLIRMLARIRISGGAQRHDDGSIELYVMMRYRSRTSPMFTVRMDPPPGGGDLDDAVIRQRIRELALRLLIALEQVPGCGDSWQALDQFLQGLQAAARQNWWQAISAYQRTLEAGGDAQHSRFGLVYYHLGSALVYQGRWAQGFDMLQKAEAFGPAMPETQYMLALTMLYMFWGELDKSDTVKFEIETRCQAALRMRRTFPEAAHILGTAYYRRARLIDRADDEKADKKKKRDSAACQSDYFRAADYFWRALRQYDRALSGIRRGIRVIGLQTADVDAFSRQRIVVAHQLGDALRGLGKFAEADQFYGDMHAVQRSNIRNISDMLKTYCLGQSWQRAQEFLYRVAKMYEPARWDSDVMIHAGWLTAGGALTISDDAKRRRLALKAFQYLDYAIYTRPRTARAWRQTEWEQPFTQLIDSFAEQGQLTLGKDVFEGEPKKLSDARVLKLWIHWRRMGFLEIENAVPGTTPDTTRKSTDDPLLAPLLQELKRDTAFVEFHNLAAEAVAFEREIASGQQSQGVERYYRRSDMAKQAYEAWKKRKDEWCETSKPLELKADKLTAALTLRGRLAFEQYVLLSLLTARLLADAHRYDPLAEVARIATHHMECFRKHWQEKHPNPDNSPGDEKHITFSPRVFRFQLAAMRAWYAYGLLHREHNLISRQVSRVIRDGFKGLPTSRSECLRQAREHIRLAREEVPVHPLVMLVNAQLLNEDGLRLQAIQELKALLDVIDPFDPKRDAAGMRQDGARPNPTSSESRSIQYFIERVIGRQQFDCVANPVAICQLMADFARDLQSDSATAYLNEAVRRSPYNDVDFELFERMGSKFNRLERYEDALAVASAMRTKGEELNSETVGVRRFAPDVMEVEAHSRQERYARAREQARQVAGRLRIPLEYIERMSGMANNASPSDRARQRTKDFVTYYTTQSQSAKQQDAIDSFNKIVPLGKPLVASLSFADGMQQIIGEISKAHGLPTSTSNSVLKLSPLFTRLNEYADEPGKFQQPAMLSSSGRSAEFWTIRKSKGKGSLYHGLNHLAESVLYVHDMGALKGLLEYYYGTSYYKSNYYKRIGKLHFAVSEMARTVIERGRQARAALIYLSDLLNTLAYTRTMMRLSGPNFAYLDSALAIYILNYLYKTCDRTHREHSLLSGKLAQACDTYGWVLYYGARPTLETMQSSRGIWQAADTLRETLAQSEEALRYALQNASDRPIIRYHLAYIHLDAAELLIDARASASAFPAYAQNEYLLIKQYLEAAENELTEASRVDQSGRLRYRIIRLNTWLKTLNKRASP